MSHYGSQLSRACVSQELMMLPFELVEKPKSAHLDVKQR